MSEIQIIETATTEREYGFRGTEAIIEHPVHGRLLISDAYGEDKMGSGMVRWEHGFAIKLRPEDTLEGLHEADWNGSVGLWEAMTKGYDDTRPMLEWTGFMVRSVAQSAGL